MHTKWSDGACNVVESTIELVASNMRYCIPAHAGPLDTTVTRDVLIMVPIANRDLPSPSLQYYHSGTTWTMNIVYQLREKGSRNFDDIYEELKWIEVCV